MGEIADLVLGYYGYDMYNAPIPYAEYMWMVTVTIVAALALWQARVFVSKF